MGTGASVETATQVEIVDIIKLRMSRFSSEDKRRLVCSIIDIAHDQGMDLYPIQARVNSLLHRKTPWPWSWSENAQKALGGDFQKVKGFTHLELCIYKKMPAINELPFIDERFDNELVSLFSAFYREHDENLYPLEIIEITATHNPILEEAMTSSTLKIHEQVALGGAYEPRWQQLESPEVVWNKGQTLEVMGLADPLTSLIGFAGQSDTAICRNICSNGFADLAKTDPGYFGRGVYLTTHAEYAALYATSTWGEGGGGIKASINDIEAGCEFTILAGYATPGLCYPITRDVDYSTSFCWSDLKGQGMKFGYHSHAVLVNRLRVLRHLNYQAMPAISTGQVDPLLAYGEIVLQHTAQALPRYVMRCRRRDDTCLAVSPGKGRLQKGFLTRPGEPEVFPPGSLTTNIQALVELFEEGNGRYWTVNTNWCRNLDIGTWMGPHYPVGVDSGGAVTKLRLSGNNLCGVLAASIGTLTNLVILDVAENQLRGEIPGCIGKLLHLEELYLDKNFFCGDLPVSVILRKAKLGRNCRVGKQQHEPKSLRIPVQWKVPDLKECIEMDKSLLEISKLNLRDCSLGDDIPPAMLEVLSDCSLCGLLPADLIPISITDIDIASNNLVGPVPPQLALFSGLLRLDLSKNRLNGHVPDLSALTTLQDLNLSYNELTGSLPPFLATLHTLRNINLSVNHLSGEVPPEYFSHLTELLRWEAASNALSGELPPSASCLTKLILFGMDHNDFVGEIPNSFANMISLRGFVVSHNKLSGEVPNELTSLPSLQRFEAAGNKLSGHLPNFGTCEGGATDSSRLRIINLGGNAFIGEVPSHWSQLTSLETVNLEDNAKLAVHSRRELFSARVELAY